jgi:hypothetical protein
VCVCVCVCVCACVCVVCGERERHEKASECTKRHQKALIACGVGRALIACGVGRALIGLELIACAHCTCAHCTCARAFTAHACTRDSQLGHVQAQSASTETSPNSAGKRRLGLKSEQGINTNIEPQPHASFPARYVCFLRIFKIPGRNAECKQAEDILRPFLCIED